MDDLIAQFVSVTSASPAEAQTFLGQANGDLATAIQTFYAASDDPMDDPVPSDDEEPAIPAAAAAATSVPAASSSLPRTMGPGGGNSLGGGATSEPLPAGWGQGGRGGGSGSRVGRVGQWGGSGGGSSFGSSSVAGGSGPRIATLGSLSGSNPSAGPPPDDDDDEDENEDKREEWYAGGERSGINVENPDRAPSGGRGVVRDILKKAREAGPPPSAGESASAAPSWGSGNTLGSDVAPSQAIRDPNAPEDDEEEDDEEVVVRHLTFWRDGFSIEDGELKRYDQPGNRELLEAINTGRAPPSLLNVRIGQPVEVRVAKRLNEDWQPAPPKPRGAWEGSGNRLGSPVPNLAPSSSAAPAPAAAASSSSANTGSGAGGDVKFEVDSSQPTTSIQIRLGDGTRLVARVNLTHTIRDIRGFINASRPGNNRAYALQTTFPSKDLTEEGMTVKEAGLAGAVVVQRWL